MLPVSPAHGGHPIPKGKKEVVAFGKLILELLLQLGNLPSLSLSVSLELRDSCVFLRNGATGMLMRSLPLLMLGFVSPPGLTLSIQQLRKFLGLEAMAL